MKSTNLKGANAMARLKELDKKQLKLLINTYNDCKDISQTAKVTGLDKKVVENRLKHEGIIVVGKEDVGVKTSKATTSKAKVKTSTRKPRTKAKEVEKKDIIVQPDEIKTQKGAKTTMKEIGETPKSKGKVTKSKPKTLKSEIQIAKKSDKVTKSENKVIKKKVQPQDEVYEKASASLVDMNRYEFLRMIRESKKIYLTLDELSTIYADVPMMRIVWYDGHMYLNLNHTEKDLDDEYGEGEWSYATTEDYMKHMMKLAEEARKGNK